MSIQYIDGPLVFRNGKYTDTITTGIFVSNNTVPVTCFTVACPATSYESYVFEGSFIGYVSNAGSFKDKDLYQKYTVMFKNNLGTVTIYKSSIPTDYPMTITKDGDSALDACTVTTAISGSSFIVRLTGIPMNQVTWAATFKLSKFIH